MRALGIALCACLGLAFPAAARAGDIQFVLETGTARRLPTDKSGDTALLAAPAAAGGLLGYAMGPMYGAGMVAGALLIVPAALVVSQHEREIWLGVGRALEQSAFEQRLLSAAQERGRTVTIEGAHTVRATLAVDGYGLAAGSAQRACVFFDVRLKLERDGQAPTLERLRISPAKPSADAPPSQCASLERFAENEGRLLRETLAESAEVLAVMAIDRIRGSEP